MIKLADLTIEKSISDWGAPVLTVTVPTGLLNQYSRPGQMRTFRLRSTVGLDGIGPREHNIHLDEIEGGGDRHGRWFGVFETTDMDEAVGSLIELLNDLNVRDRVLSDTASLMSDLGDALNDFNDALGDTSWRDWRKEWARIRGTVTALDMLIHDIHKEEP